ncbi:MAG: signal peptidase I [Bacteroidaceae bacterium]
MIFLFAVSGIIFCRLFLFEICVVSSESMVPTINPTEVLVLNKISYGALRPQRWGDIPLVNVFTWIDSWRKSDSLSDWGYKRFFGIREPMVNDIAVFKTPFSDEKLLVKRIHCILKKGTPIDVYKLNKKILTEIIVKDGHIIRYEGNCIYIDNRNTRFYHFCEDFYDMRGDNTNNSSDSRTFGYIPESYIVGKMGAVLFSWNSEATGWSKVRWKRLLRTVT